jgi:hypothetical protein
MQAFMVNLVELMIRSVIFAVPVAFVAQWWEVEPTWKTVAFVAFCMVWSGCLERSSPSRPDEPSEAGSRKGPAEILTRAEVAFEARKLTPRPLRHG